MFGLAAGANLSQRRLYNGVISFFRGNKTVYSIISLSINWQIYKNLNFLFAKYCLLLRDFLLLSFTLFGIYQHFQNQILNFDRLQPFTAEVMSDLIQNFHSVGSVVIGPDTKDFTGPGDGGGGFSFHIPPCVRL